MWCLLMHINDVQVWNLLLLFPSYLKPRLNKLPRKKNPVMSKVSLTHCVRKLINVTDDIHYLFCTLMLLKHGNIENSPDPQNLNSYFSYYHSNVNSLITHNIVLIMWSYNLKYKMIYWPGPLIFKTK